MWFNLPWVINFRYSHCVHHICTRKRQSTQQNDQHHLKDGKTLFISMLFVFLQTVEKTLAFGVKIVEFALFSCFVLWYGKAQVEAGYLISSSYSDNMITSAIFSLTVLVYVDKINSYELVNLIRLAELTVIYRAVKRKLDL